MTDRNTVPAAASFAYDTARTHLFWQLEQVDACDEKAGHVLTAVALVGGLFFAANPTRDVNAIIAFLVVLLLVASGLLAVAALLPRQWVVAPLPDEVAKFAGGQEDELKYKLTGSVLDAIKKNAPTLETKVRCITVAAGLVLLGIATLGGYVCWTATTK